MASSDGSLMFQGVRPLQQLQRDLACASRALVPVLDSIANWGQGRVSDIAKDTGISGVDVRRALYALEDAGLVESTGYTVTEAGKKAVKDA